MIEVPGWNGNHRIFKELISSVKPRVILEIGSWKGQSAINMATICKGLGLDTRIYCIDTWLGAVEFMTASPDDKERDLMKIDGYPMVYHEFMKNIRESHVDDMITPVPNTSLIASFVVPDADLIYIDGDHSYESVMQDIAVYTKKLNPGGVIFGDDYSVFEGVKRAVDQSFNNVRILDNFWIK